MVRKKNSINTKCVRSSFNLTVTQKVPISFPRNFVCQLKLKCTHQSYRYNSAVYKLYRCANWKLKTFYRNILITKIRERERERGIEIFNSLTQYFDMPNTYTNISRRFNFHVLLFIHCICMMNNTVSGVSYLQTNSLQIIESI